jgi:hypothetical protein
MRFLAKAFVVRAIALATLALAGCSEEKISCAIGEGDRATTISLTHVDCTQVQTALTAQKAQQTPAAAQPSPAERQKAVEEYRADVTDVMRKYEANGYKTTSIENFKLQGEDLAHHDAKVAVQGVYIKTGLGEFLMPSLLAASQVDIKRTPDEGVNLLSRSASRSAKRAFAQCQKDSVKSTLGCPMTVLGKAVLCERTTIFGTALAACIAVNDTWYIAPPS